MVRKRLISTSAGVPQQLTHKDHLRQNDFEQWRTNLTRFESVFVLNIFLQFILIKVSGKNFIFVRMGVEKRKTNGRAAAVTTLKRR